MVYPTETFTFICDFPTCDEVWKGTNKQCDWLVVKFRRNDSTIWSEDLYYCPKHYDLYNLATDWRKIK